jgi:phospholipase C
MVTQPSERNRQLYQTEHTVFDHTSVLRFIEWRWGLKPLTIRDDTADNIAEALDFRRRARSAPRYLIPPGPYGAPCEPALAPEPNKWFAVREMARGFGFVMPD